MLKDQVYCQVSQPAEDVFILRQRLPSFEVTILQGQMFFIRMSS